MNKFANIKVSMELVVPAYRADWGKKALADYLNTKLYTDPEFFGDFGEENIIEVWKEQS